LILLDPNALPYPIHNALERPKYPLSVFVSKSRERNVLRRTSSTIISKEEEEEEAVIFNVR
jgi:hypothetical protein